MEILEAINSRRSVREFLKKKISKSVIKKLITLASKAPSDENSQPWEFIIVENEKIKEQIGEISVFAGRKYFGSKKAELMKKFESLGENRSKEMVEKFITGALFSFLKTAPILIIAISKKDFFSCCSTSASIENLMLAAQDFNLATCWTVIGLTNEQSLNKIKNLTEIPKDKTIIAILALGYPAKMPKPRARKNVDEICRWIE